MLFKQNLIRGKKSLEEKDGMFHVIICKATEQKVSKIIKCLAAKWNFSKQVD